MMPVDPYLLIVAASVVVLVGLFVLIKRRDGGRQQVQSAARQSLTQTGQAHAEFAAAAERAMCDLKESVESLATCMANLELRMRAVDARQRKFDEVSAQLLRRRGFDEALHLVRDGKSSSEIARQCAMPLAEVELLQRIHRQGLSH